MNNKIAFESLVMDLKRVALGFQRGSDKSAIRFAQEALKRMDEIDTNNTKIYINKLLQKLPNMLNQNDKLRIAEDALMYSTLLQNYTLTFLQ
jgi:hypothetical protein